MHLRSVFDRQLALLDAQLLVMSSTVEGAVEVFVERDAEQAARVIGEDEGINLLFGKVKKDIATAIQTEADPASSLVEALMIAKYLERIGDHAKNIAEWVEYSLTGRYKGGSIG